MRNKRGMRILSLEGGKWADGIKFKRSGLYGGDRLEIILILLVF